MLKAGNYQVIKSINTPQSELSKNSIKRLINGKTSTNDIFIAEFEINDVGISARNILTKGQTHDEIAQQSGASISTRGRYISSTEKARGLNNSRPLYLFIQGDTHQSLNLAIEKIKEVIVKDQNKGSNKTQSNMAKFNTRPPPTIASQQHANQGGSSYVEKLIIGLEHAPAAFNIREQVIGAGGANLHYIRNETGAIATLRGRGSHFIDPVLGTESSESLHLYIEHQRIDGLQAAKQLAKNLIETLHQEVVHLQQQTNQHTQNISMSNNNTLVSQNQAVAHLNVPPPMLAVPPPVIQQNSLDGQGNQATLVPQNFIQQNPPPNLSAPPPQSVQSQQQTIIHQQIIPQAVPIQLQQSNVVIQQPVQQPAIANVNIPPPGIPIPIKTGQIVQFQQPPPATPASHLSQPPPNIQLQHQAAPTQILLNHPQSYQYQYIQQPVQTGDSSMQQNQVTIQHIYQPQQQIQGIVQQAQTQSQPQQIQASAPQQYITVQGNTAYMVPPPTIIHQQAAQQHNAQAHVQTQIANQNSNIIFQSPPQLQQVQMQMTQGISVQNMPPPFATSTTTIQESLNQSSNSDDGNNASSIKEEQRSDGERSESPPQKSPEMKTDGDLQSNDNNSENGTQQQQTGPTTALTMSVPPPPVPNQSISIRQPPPSITTSITLPVNQMPPPIMAVPPPMSCVQHFVGNTLITTQPTAQTHTHQIYSHVPVSIQQIPQTAQQIHVSAPNGQHFLVNATPQWQGPPPTLTQQPPIQQISQNGTIQNVQITSQQFAHNGTDFRTIPPPTIVSQTNANQPGQQSSLVQFQPQVQVQFQPQLVQQIPPPQQIDQTHIISGQMATQQQFNVIQHQPQLSYHQTVMAQFHPQQQIKQISYQEQNLRSTGHKRKHENDDGQQPNHQPRMGMGQRDQNQPIHGAVQQLNQPPPTMPLTSVHGSNLGINQAQSGSSNNSSNAGQDENAEQKSQLDLHQQLGQPPPPPPPLPTPQPGPGSFSDNRHYYHQRGGEGNESFVDGPSSRQQFDGPPFNNSGAGPPMRGRFHHNNGMIGPGPGYPMRPPFHLQSELNGNNFPMHRMNFGPPPLPPYRGDCPPNMNGGFGPPPPRFRGQW